MAKYSLETKIRDLNLSTRTTNCTWRAGIYTLEQLVHYTESDLLNIRNFGAKSIIEVEAFLKGIGLKLGMTKKEIEECRVSTMSEEEKQEYYNQKEKNSKINGIFNMPIENLDFSIRTYNILKREGISNISDLVQYSEEELGCIRNLSKESIEEIKNKILNYTGVRFEDLSDEASLSLLEEKFENQRLKRQREQLEETKQINEENKRLRKQNEQTISELIPIAEDTNEALLDEIELKKQKLTTLQQLLEIQQELMDQVHALDQEIAEVTNKLNENSRQKTLIKDNSNE